VTKNLALNSGKREKDEILRGSKTSFAFAQNDKQKGIGKLLNLNLQPCSSFHR